MEDVHTSKFVIVTIIIIVYIGTAAVSTEIYP